MEGESSMHPGVESFESKEQTIEWKPFYGVEVDLSALTEEECEAFDNLVPSAETENPSGLVSEEERMLNRAIDAAAQAGFYMIEVDPLSRGGKIDLGDKLRVFHAGEEDTMDISMEKHEAKYGPLDEQQAA